MHFPRTQPTRPTLLEATEEAMKSPDTHWTAQLSSAGMTRISRAMVAFTWQQHYIEADEDPTAGFLYEAHWDGAK